MGLLGRVAGAHPQLAVAPEVDWITDFFETRSGPNLEGLLAPELIDKWVQQRRFDPFGLDGAAVEGLLPPGGRLPFRSFLTRLFDLYGAARGKPLVGCTSLDSPQQIPALHALWPWAKFVHLIRDGRDVWLSLRDGDQAGRYLGRYPTWREDPIGTAAWWWQRRVRKGLRVGRALGPGRYLEVRYEALVARPAQECARLCAFLGLPYDDAMPRFHEGPCHGDKGAWRPITPGLRDWRSQLGGADAERFEAAAGQLLDELGYPRAYPHPRPEAVGQAARVQECCARPPESLRRPRQAEGRSNPFVFIVGCPRSGTTLLQRIVGAHPDVVVCDETFWVVYYYKKRLGLTPEGLVTPELAGRLFEYYKFYRMKLGHDEVARLARPGQPYAEFVTGLFDLHAEVRGKPLVGDKTPDYVRNLPTLHALWPQARFVHLIRDGRDVALSAINWKRKAARLAGLYSTWGEHPVTTAALWWEWHVRLGRQAGVALGPGRYLEVRYEALVARPAQECARLCAFLGLPYDDAMLRFHEGRCHGDSGLDAKTAWQPITPGLRDWRTQLAAADAERFEAAAGELLDELGYPRAAPTPRPEVVAHAAGIRDQFTRDACALGDWLP
jgi:hypothetical protein